MKRSRRIICMALCFAMLAGYIPAPVHAEDLSQQGLCEHHPEHIGCSYAAAINAAECGHQHEDVCYSLKCVHVHEDCGYVAAVEGVACDHQHDDTCGYTAAVAESACTCTPVENVHAEGCTYAPAVPEGECSHEHGACSFVEAKDEIPCGHDCAKDAACSEKVLTCVHEHDEECGYAEAREAVACDFVCEECANAELEIAAVEEHRYGTVYTPYTHTNDSSKPYSLVDGIYYSTNHTKNSAASYTIAANFDTTISFNYGVSSESGCDEFTLKHNETQLFCISGLDSGKLTIDLSQGDVLVFTYEKDDSESERDDRGWFEITSGDNYLNEELTTPNCRGDVCCLDCGDVLYDRLPHNIITVPAVEPTCTTEGKTSGQVCSECGFVSVAQDPIPMAAHSFINGICTICETVTYSEGITFKLNDDGTFYIVSGIGTFTGESLVIPQTYNRLPVKEIGVSAFANCSKLTSVTIPSSITAIGDKAFYNCTGLKGVYISDLDAWCDISFDYESEWDEGLWVESYSNPLKYAHNLYLNGEKVTDIVLSDAPRGFAFYGCNLNSVTFTRQVGLNKGVFRGSSLREIYIPGGPSYLREYSLYNCSNITGAFYLPASVTEVGDWTFWGPNIKVMYLEGSKIPDRCDDLDYGNTGPFSGSGANVVYNCQLVQVDGNDYIIKDGEAWFIRCPQTRTGAVEILSQVTYGGQIYNVTKIGDYAFYNCDQITSITVPEPITSIGQSVFNGVTATAYYPDNHDTWTDAVKQQYGGTITWVPYTVEHTHEYGDDYKCECGAIGGICGDNLTWKFDAATGILTMSGTGDMKNYGSSTAAPWMEYKDKITTVEMESGITSIGSYAFSGCSVVTEVNIADSVTHIGSGAFAYCIGLKRIYIPDSVTTISASSYASSPFYGCDSPSITGTVIYCEVGTVPAGWSTYWNYYGSSGSILTTHYGYTEDEYLWWSSVDKNVWPQNVIIPDHITRIPDNALSGYSNISSICIPDSVTSIGKNAFKGCTGLKGIYIPSSVTTISASSSSDSPFYSCSSNLMISCGSSEKPDGWGKYWNYYGSGYVLTTYYGKRFAEHQYWSTLNKATTGIYIPDYVTWIPQNAFSDCTQLTYISIPDSVTSIEKNAFKNCTGLKSLYVPSSVATISASNVSNSPFYGCSSSLKLYCGAPSVPSGWGPCWYYYGSSSTLSKQYGCTRNEYEYWRTLSKSAESITIPDYVTYIPENAFADCTELKSITIPDSVTSIGKNAFQNCTGLKRIFIPDSVTTIPATYYTHSPFYGCDYNLKIYCEALSSPDGWGPNLTQNSNVYFGYTREEYNYWDTLDNTDNSIQIPYYVTHIPSDAFSDCTNITSISIPDSVTSIGQNAFKNCTGLKSIFIPDSVVAISAETDSKSPFYGCSSNLKIYCNVETPPDGWDSYWYYYGAYSVLTRHYGITREEYGFWNTLDKTASNVSIPDYVTSIPKSAFSEFTSLTSITIPDGITSIGEKAFSGCSSLTTILLPDSVTSIGNKAFINCTGLKRVYIPSSVTTITAADNYDSPFYGCSAALTIYCADSKKPDGWSSYWNYHAGGSYSKLSVFYESTPEEFSYWDTINQECTIVTIPDYITRIPAQAFRGCSNLTDITIHDTVTCIEKNAFTNCTGLETIYFPNSITTINTSSESTSPFYGCSSDLVIYCAASSTQSGWGSYWNYISNSRLKVIYGCSPADYSRWKTISHNNTEIVIPDGISLIPESMFSSNYSYKLSKVTIPASVTNIGNNAFSGCYNLTDIYFGGTWNQWNDVVIGTGNSYLQKATVHYGVSPTAGTFGENLTWTYDAASTTLTISGIGAMPDYEHGDQPWGQWLGNISQIIIEDGVTDLGDNAFYTIVDVSASIPTSVTAIKDAFQYIHNVHFTFGGTMRQWAKLDDGSNGGAVCTDGTVLTCGSSGHTDSSGEWIVTGTWYLENNGTLYIDGGGKSMDDSELSLFANTVTSMVIWNGTEEVAGFSYNLYNLREITIPATLKKLDLGWAQWFEKININDLAAWCELDCAYYLGGELYLDGNRISDLVIPDTVTRIGRYALAQKNSIRSVVIPESVTEIADYAFAQSWNIDSIRFKGSAPSFGENAFMEISTTIYYPAEDSSWEWISQNTYGANEITWNDTNNAQGTCGWECTWSLQNGKLTVTGDGYTYDYSPEYPAPWAILADLIQEIFVDHTVYGIGSNSFSDLTQLKRVVIGDNISWIRSGAFSGCAALTEVIFLGDYPYEVADDAFSGVTATVHYPAGWYWNEDDLQNYGGNLTWIEDGVELRRLTLYGDRFTHAVGQTIYVGTDISPWNASWDFEFTVSDPDILEIISQNNRSCTVKTLAAGTASVTVTDSLSGLEAVREITVIEPQSISCSYTAEISVPEEDSVRYYQFTPEEDGWYGFSTDAIECLENGDWYGNWIDVIENDQYVEVIYRADEHKCVTFAELKAGVSYQVCVGFNWSAYAQTSTFSLEKVSASDVFPDDPGTLPEEPEFGFYTDSIVEDFLPGEISSRHLSLNNNELEEVIWASSDPAIIEIEESYSDYCWYKILNPGTATITASCNGKSDSVTITVTAIEILELYVSEPLTSNEEYISKDFGFMAPEDGRYVFTVAYDPPSTASIGLTSWSSDDNISHSYGTDYRVISRDMYAGEICRFHVNGSGSSCSVRVSKAASRPLSMQIVQLSDYPGTVSFGTGFNPRNSSDRIVKWEINDPTIAGESSNPNYNSSRYENKVYYNIYKDGKLTVTATSESGLKASLTVDVRAYACQNGHAYGEWVPVLDENGAETGSERRECENCGEYQQRKMPPLDETVENRVILDASELAGYSTVWIDGTEYTLSKHDDKCYVDLPDGNAHTMVIYTYNSSTQNRYPVGMKVWTLENENGAYTVTRQESFDDILQYSGMSIRVTGKKGIRMITSIEKAKKNALVSDGLAGYTLKEYGTAIAWASQISETNPLVLGTSYVKSNYAYKKGVADPVFAYSGDLMQYTNVLVNFSNEQCKDDIAMRSYMILEDESGEELVIYGGIVNRSIGYIAYQNRNVFEPQTDEYNYIWNIIHYVYGDVYDDDFIHAWTPSTK